MVVELRLSLGSSDLVAELDDHAEHGATDGVRERLVV
jgi:hypothetical protein